MKRKIAKSARSHNDLLGQRIGVDMTSSKRRTAGGNRCAQVCLDCKTDCMHTSSMKKKSMAADEMLKFIDEMVGMGKEPPSFIRLDRSGENSWT